jgi:hypothetical protein
MPPSNVTSIEKRRRGRRMPASTGRRRHQDEAAKTRMGCNARSTFETPRYNIYNIRLKADKKIETRI